MNANMNENTQAQNRKTWPNFGRVVSTRSVGEWLKEDGRVVDFAQSVFSRFSAGDWGDIDSDDWSANDSAILDGSRILAAYSFDGRKIWIVTDAENESGEREYTSIMFPSEY